MIQVIFFALLIVSLIAGAFTYFAPTPKPINPLKTLMDDTGFTASETTNTKRSQEINVTTSAGIMQVRKQMDDLAVVQQDFLKGLQDQQQILNNTTKDATDVLLAAKKQGAVADKDILQLEAVTSQIQDKQRLLIAQGQDLVAMNDQLSQNRQLLADQADYADFYTESILKKLRNRNAQLKAQAADMIDRRYAYDQELKESLARMHEQLQEFVNTTEFSSKVQEQVIKDRIRRMLDKEHEDGLKLAEIISHTKELLMEAHQKAVDAKELSSDAQLRAQELIDEDKQKADDEQAMIQQRMDDQRQRMQDQKDQQAMKKF